MSSVPGVTPCAQCVGNGCAAAGCNLSCEYFPNGCNTIVSGFRAGDEEPLFDAPAGFGLFNISDELKKQGVENGDVLTHINKRNLYGTLTSFIKSTEGMAKGTVLWIRKSDRTRLEITL
jgi:hypothetical protein